MHHSLIFYILKVTLSSVLVVILRITLYCENYRIYAIIKKKVAFFEGGEEDEEKQSGNYVYFLIGNRKQCMQ